MWVPCILLAAFTSVALFSLLRVIWGQNNLAVLRLRPFTFRGKFSRLPSPPGSGALWHVLSLLFPVKKYSLNLFNPAIDLRIELKEGRREVVQASAIGKQAKRYTFNRQRQDERG